MQRIIATAVTGMAPRNMKILLFFYKLRTAEHVFLISDAFETKIHLEKQPGCGTSAIYGLKQWKTIQFLYLKAAIFMASALFI